MKKIILLTVLVLAMVSCKENAQTEENTVAQKEQPTEDMRTLKGEFIYLADAAVLNCGNKIYGVVIDAKMHELADQVAAKKNDEFDMVPVIIKGVVTPKTTTEEGWPEIVTIKEIVKVFEPTGESAVKIESGK